MTISGHFYRADLDNIVKVRCRGTPSLGSAAFLRVIVRDYNGFPVPGASVHLARLNEPLVADVPLYVGNDGTLERALPVGQWQLQIDLGGSSPARTSLTLASGKTCTVECFFLFKDSPFVT